MTASPSQPAEQPRTRTASHPRRQPPQADPRAQAHKIADAVDEAWHREYGHGWPEVPVSVVAALSLLAPGDTSHASAALLALDPAGFAQLVRTQWAAFIRHRPDLVNRVWPLAKPWYSDPPLPGEALRAAKKTADAAVRAGQLDLTGTHRRVDADLFGVLLSVLRSRSAKAARGQFHTPAEVGELMAGMLDLAEQTSIHEPAAGTGGLLRAAAHAMRQHGQDPATVTWVAVDTDELSIACLAVNVVLWGLGHKVLLGVGNGL